MKSLNLKKFPNILSKKEKKIEKLRLKNSFREK